MATSNALPAVGWPPHFSADASAFGNRRSLPELRTILVPMSFSERSLAGLAIGWNLARESGARLVLLHVAQLNIAGEERGINLTGLRNELCRDAEGQLRRVADRLSDDVDTETIVCEGNPASVILEVAQSLAADTIVLREPKRSWLTRLLPGTSDRVTRNATCPVWLVSPANGATALNVTIVDRAREWKPPAHSMTCDETVAPRAFTAKVAG